MNCLTCERRMFSFEREGATRWFGIPTCETLRQPGGPKKVTEFEDGEQGEGELELKGEVFTLLFTCIEP